MLVNEVEVDPPSASDDACQYVELSGAPGYVVPSGTFFVSVNGDSGAFGSITNAVDLSGATVGANGTITIILDPVNIAECAGRAYDPDTTLVLVDDTFTIVGLGAESYLLVNTPLGVSDGDDIDVNNDEAIDPARLITVVDGFAFTVNNTLQAAYGPLVYDALTQGGGSADLPDAAARCFGNITPLSVAAWRYGELPGAPDNALGPFAVPTNAAGYFLTPSSQNNPCP